MRFLVDAQLPSALARWISAQDHDARHVSDVGLLHARDGRIWEHAVRREASIITKDEDFPRRRLMAKSGPPIIWIRRGNASRRELLTWFTPIFPHVVIALSRGETVIEIV